MKDTVDERATLTKRDESYRKSWIQILKCHRSKDVEFMTGKNFVYSKMRTPKTAIILEKF